MTMLPIRALTVCVGYDDLLRVTLPTVLPHVQELLVITSPADTRTTALTVSHGRVRVHQTDAFYRGGAKFNKGLAIEEGFDALGRDGWILVLDADIVLPPDTSERLGECGLTPGRLYTPRRRILDDPTRYPLWSDHTRWRGLPLRREDHGFYGYFQLFHAADPVLARRPWYGVNWTHAGHCDNEFQRKWDRRDKHRPAFEVLHLGRCDTNWFGRVSGRIDGAPADPEATARRELQERLRRKYGWGRGRTGEPLQERVGGEGL
jgi:hypothetical protein